MRGPYRPIGILEYWNIGILGYWKYWDIGILGYWHIWILEILGYWDLGILKYWDTGNIGTHSIVMRRTELDRVMPWRERVQ